MDGPRALRETIAALRGRAGAGLVPLFVAIGAATVVAQQTLADAAARLAARADVSTGSLLLDPAATATPLSLGVSYPVALATVFGVALVAEYAAVVTLRVVTGSALRSAATRRVVTTVAVGFLVGSLVRTLVALGLLALVVPGVFLAVSLLFAHAAIAIDDAGPWEALERAWELASGRRTELAGILSLLVVLYLTPRLVGSYVPGTPGLLAGGAVAGVGGLLSAGVVGRAYHAATREGDEPDHEPEETDPYDAPLGADDLPEPE
ncbi:hypothetical protein [Halosegnis sp.]|uniref:hypothetical protein n=1 Tax=Halosegnis sp. TaxID=2864959 RepID=UPI0035D525BB